MATIHNFTARQPYARTGAGSHPLGSAPAHTGDDFIRADGRTRLGTCRPADLRCFTRDKDAGALVEWATPEAYLRPRNRLSDPSFVASVEVVVMTLVCAFVGAMLACGGVL